MNDKWITSNFRRDRGKRENLVYGMIALPRDPPSSELSQYDQYQCIRCLFSMIEHGEGCEAPVGSQEQGVYLHVVHRDSKQA